MSCECLLNWWGILETGSTSWGGWYKNSETHNYCKCTLLTAASVVTVSADLHTMFSSLHLLNLDLSLKNKQQGGYISCWGWEEPSNTHSYNHKQPYWLFLWLFTHTGVWFRSSLHTWQISPPGRVYLHFYKSTMKADVMFYAAVQMSSTALHRTDVVQRSLGWEQTECQWSKWGNELKNMGLLQQSPWTIHLP